MRHEALLLPVCLAAAGCGGGRDGTEASAAPQRPPVSVSALRLAPETLTERLELSGVLEPWVKVEIASELGGRVEEVAFDDGQRVREGRLLARVGTDILQAALDEAEAVRDGAQADFERIDKLFERQAVPRQQLLAATSRHEAARAQVAQARLRVERSVLRAPIAGVALSREIEPGEVLAPGALITTLHQVIRLKARAGIPEADIAAFRIGGEASLEVEAYPGETFSGRIHFVGPAALGPSRTFPVDVEIANRDGRLRPGMLARLSLVKRHMEGVVVVDRDVLLERDDGSVAAVLDGELARIRPLVLGPTEGNRIVIEQGLTLGDWLIVSGQRGLVDGQRVAVVERRSPPAPGEGAR